MTIWRMRIACRIPKDKNTHSQSVIRIAPPVQKMLHARASVLPNKHIGCLIYVLSCGWTQWRTDWGFKPSPPKFRRYRWSPRSHEQEEPASRFPFVVQCSHAVVIY